jgi:DNA-binding SARP family transcriptional activator
MLYLRTMGALSLHRDGPDGPVLSEGSKYLVLLAWLSVAPGKRASRDYLSSLLWPTAERKARLSSLRQCLYSLGKDGAAPAFESTDDSVALDPQELRTDVDDFRAALEMRDYEAAIRLAPGEFLEGTRNGLGHEIHHWIDAENERIRIGLTLAYSETVGRYLRRQDPARAVEVAREYARREPLSEHAQVLLVQAHRAAGNDPGALAAYEAYRSLLQDAVGDRPGPELEASVARVREELLRTPEVSMPDLLAQSPLPAPSARRSPGLVLALVAMAVVAAAAIGWATRGTLTRTDAWISHVSVQLPVALTGDDSVFWLEVEDGRARYGDPALDSDRVGPESVPSPDHRYLAEPFEVPSGYDLKLVDRASGGTRTLLATPADEKALDWSPDGRYLAFGFGLAAGEGGRYWHGIGVYDVTRDSIVYLRESGKESGRTTATWSPDGTRIAYVSGPDSALTITVIDADGGRRHVVAGNVTEGSRPAWSTDSRRVLFAAGTGITYDLHSVRAEGTGLTRLTDFGDIQPPYVWVAPDAALFFRGSPLSSRPWALNPATGEVRPIDTPDGDTYATTTDRWTQYRRPEWVSDVRIHGVEADLAPGQHVALTLESRTTDGKIFAVDPSAVRWSVSDSAAARVEGGALVAAAAGAFQLVGSAGGWRADTITVRVADLVTALVEPAFDEDWSAGLDTAVWVPVGEPLPFVSSSGGPDSAPVFVNNGDKNYLSGAFTRRAFSLANGITVEVWGRMPFDGEHFQAYTVRLLDPAEARRLWKPEERWIVDVFEASDVGLHFSGYGTVSALRRSDLDVALPWPDPPADWRLYTLQVEPDGTTSVHYDDVLVARVPGFIPVSTRDSVLVAIGGNSWNAQVEHGRLRVYEGLRYQLR